MNKILIIFLIVLLIGNLFAYTSFEQQVYGILSEGNALPNQKVAAYHPLIADFGLGPNNEFSYIGNVEDIDVICKKIEGPENLVVSRGEGGMCIVRWDDELTANPTLEEKGNHYVEIKVENANGDASLYFFTITVYSWMIKLDKKWNLISIPLVPEDENTSINSIFGEIINNSKVIWEYGYDRTLGTNVWKFNIPTEDGLKWSEDSSRVQNIIPGYGYYIKMTNESILYQNGKDFYEINLPSQVYLTSGWNLIGHYGLANKTAYCSLFSLVNAQIGFPRWSSLWKYKSGTNAHFEPLSPLSLTNPGEGYWIELDVDDVYTPSSC